MKTELLASAATLESIKTEIDRFYCGSSKTLIPTGNDSWKIVCTQTGKEATMGRVVRKRGRFRFEAVLP
jgi:hypothetical protein